MGKFEQFVSYDLNFNFYSQSTHIWLLFFLFCLQALVLWWINMEGVDLFASVYVVRVTFSRSWLSPPAFIQIYTEDNNTELKNW